jgi:hypothetical protein
MTYPLISGTLRDSVDTPHKVKEQAQMKSEIFLSYSRADHSLGEQFVRTGETRGLNIWFDDKIEGGENWRQKCLARQRPLSYCFLNIPTVRLNLSKNLPSLTI